MLDIDVHLTTVVYGITYMHVFHCVVHMQITAFTGKFNNSNYTRSIYNSWIMFVNKLKVALLSAFRSKYVLSIYH